MGAWHGCSSPRAADDRRKFFRTHPTLVQSPDASAYDGRPSWICAPGATGPSTFASRGRWGWAPELSSCPSWCDSSRNPLTDLLRVVARVAHVEVHPLGQREVPHARVF